MPGTNNATNRFGPSSYCVGPQLGNGVNFTDIQAAINQAVADGFDATNPCTILVRPGTYSSFTLAPGILVEGVCAGSVFSNYVSVIGNVTIDSTTPGGILYSMKNLNISDPVDAVIIQGVGSPIFVDIANCSINGSRGIVIGNTSGTLSQFGLRECRVVGSVIAVDLQNHNALFTEQTTFSAPDCIVLSGDARGNFYDCVIDGTGTYAFEITGIGNRLNLNYCNITSISEAILGVNAGESVNVNHCTIDSSAVSGNYIDNVSTFQLGDVVLTGSALNNNAIATTYPDWQPYAQTAAAASPIVFRGTCAFDSSQFSVTNGWVHANFGGLFPWVEQNASVTVNPNEGNFSVANITLTLPAQPQPIGTTCKFKVVTNDTLVIAGNVGDVLQFGTQSGTTITNSASGDAIEMTHYDLGIWLVNSSVGNWTVA